MDNQIDKNSYLAFDALTLKQHIKDQLNKSGVFTDQKYEGSNVSTVIDLISYSFNTLMFYLNKTASEGQFSQAEIYENMNQIVKVLDYKPIGKQTSTLSFVASADSTGAMVDTGLYTIPRYSFFQLEGVPYSFTEDITFAKTVSGMESLTDLSNEKLLYQGKFEEYPIYTSVGQENEIITVAPGDTIIIDHFNIHVYVKSILSGTWKQWNQTPSLYLENANAEKYEVRYNENKRYEIKFGNSINGVKLQSGDQVAIYYLKSSGSSGEVGIGVLENKPLVSYATVQYNQIIPDVIAGQYDFIYDYSSLYFNNESVSTYVGTEETVDQIRQNAPGIFRSQYRLVTTDDYSNYCKTNFANIINDVTVVNNWTYLSEQMKYYHDMGLNNPAEVSRALFNQVVFGDACNFNNIYILVVPRVVTGSKIEYSVLSPSQKELITSSMRSEKTTTSEIILLDPVYVATTIAIPKIGATGNETDIDNTELYVVKDPASRRDANSIKNDIKNIFTTYFSRNNTHLGQVIDIKQLTANILAVNGVKTFYTRRTDDTSVAFEGLSMLVWNPIYTADKNLIVRNLSLPYFKYPYFYDIANITNKINVQSETKIYENIEY